MLVVDRFEFKFCFRFRVIVFFGKLFNLLKFLKNGDIIKFYRVIVKIKRNESMYIEF